MLQKLHKNTVHFNGLNEIASFDILSTQFDELLSGIVPYRHVLALTLFFQCWHAVLSQHYFLEYFGKFV